MSQKLLASYVNPSEPGSLGGVAKFAKAHGLSNLKAKKLLDGVLSYTLHKSRRRKFPTIPVMVFSIDQQWVMDLMEVQKLAKWNQGHRYILTVVDVLSKYAWTVPLQNNTGTAMVKALQDLRRQVNPRKPERVQGDDATEFFNSKLAGCFTESHLWNIVTKTFQLTPFGVNFRRNVFFQCMVYFLRILDLSIKP